ncbi:sugar transferase [Anaerocolumna xylanovorans]|uniref:Sugar transferase involved in LPS biosynthesis (Colanic, teichoic acid) n=1 Tax=Anaerocolumna xylanovorans DSM 12503 TaxID=1121345 RepID=A0A1M7Y1J8_9FIRM|nr:sugar transferase [Anaerocolumna xylanovorans]SHO45701.1 Sugar transferase involved in LPS biosynthesis (colanic, teichoic acid) [Anaerocolumna xylanovorans DSM 12503]
MSKLYERKGKRMFDFVISLAAVLLLFPLLLIIGIIIKLEDGGGILFTQYRLGKNRVPFKIYKFRTMKENHEDPDIRAFKGDKRITGTGAFLRRTSLDELPQFINILKGDMAIVGPRPILPEEGTTSEEDFPYEKRFSCLPGLFCTVDMKYRAAADRELQFTMDVSYAENISFRKDIAITFSTAVTVLLGRNVYSQKLEKERGKKL